ncbi:MAG: twin-arginine translocase TatA/TatE family subunit [Saprospiraceae bacterium]
MQSLLLFNFLGPEMIIVFFAILLLFGGKKIPELMRGIGKGIREFNTARTSLESELKTGMKEDEEREREKQRERDRVRREIRLEEEDRMERERLERAKEL